MSDRTALRMGFGSGESQRQLMPTGTMASERQPVRPGNVSARSKRRDQDQGLGGEEVEGLLDNEDEAIEHPPECLDETTYGFAITSIVRDSVAMVSGRTEAHYIRVGRLATSILLILLTMFLQLYVMYQVARLLCGRAVGEIRTTYAEYEEHMYADHTQLVHGHVRGIPGYLQAERFKELSESQQEMVCEIPLAHPYFLCTVLLIWTLTCLRDLRKLLNQSFKILWVTPTVDSLAQLENFNEGEIQIDGLTRSLKTCIAVIYAMRIFTVLALLWLGCRWLTATIGLDDMFLNGLALEFVLLLQELIYAVLVPHRHQIATTSTMILPMSWPGKEKAQCFVFFGAFMWMAVAVGWVLLYIYKLQSVLPAYQWDVREVCALGLATVRLT